MQRLYFLWIFLLPLPALAQLERQLEDADPLVELTFHAPRHLNVLTVEPLGKNELHFSIMHTFGTLDNGAGNLWGLDNGANIRLSFEYAFSDRFSVGFGRSSVDKVFDFYGRYHLLRQTRSGSMPVSVSIAGNMSINSANYDFIPSLPEGGDRWSYFGQIMIARKFSEKMSFQLAPMVAYFNQANPVYAIESRENLHLAAALSGKIKITGKTSITAQYIPNLNSNRRSNLGVGIDMEAGGHVFQMYFVTSRFLNEQYLLAGENGVPGEQFRLGFNVNRIFSLGGY